MKVKEFTDMLGSFTSIIVAVEKNDKVIAFNGIYKKLGCNSDLEVNLHRANKDVEFSVAEINNMEIIGVLTAADDDTVRLWLDV